MIQGSLNADFVVVTDVSSSDKIHPTVQTVADDKVERDARLGRSFKKRSFEGSFNTV